VLNRSPLIVPGSLCQERLVQAQLSKTEDAKKRGRVRRRQIWGGVAKAAQGGGLDNPLKQTWGGNLGGLEHAIGYCLTDTGWKWMGGGGEKKGSWNTLIVDLFSVFV